MTIIAGVIHGGRVHLAADSGWSNSYMDGTQWEPKVRRLRDDVVVGAAGGRRFCDVVLRRLDISRCDTTDVEWWMADEIRRLCSEAGLNMHQDSGHYEIGGALFGVGDRLSRMDNTFGVVRHRTVYTACGTGSETANGAMWVATRAPDWKPRGVLRAAVRAAAAHCPSIAGPFRFVSTRSEG